MQTTTRQESRRTLTMEETTRESTTLLVSKRDRVSIVRQVEEIRAGWSAEERRQRAQLGRQRRAELCRLLSLEVSAC